MQLFIRPLDTQFHRNGLPFDAGEDTEADSFFPPFPRTLYGALRAAGMLRSGGCLDFNTFIPGDEKVFGDKTRFGTLRLLGPVPARLDEGCQHHYDPCFPVPRDLVAVKDTGGLRLLSPTQRIGAGRDTYPDHPVLDWVCAPGDEEVEGLSGECLLPYHLLRNYLLHNGAGFQQSKRLHLIRSEKVFCSEVHTGIQRSTTFTAAESMLYTVRHHRMNDDPQEGGPCGLLACIEAEGGHFVGAGLLQLGGDFRAAAWTVIPDGKGGPWWKMHNNAVLDLIAKTGRFKAFFITPALFQKGCVPDLKGIGTDVHHDKISTVALDISMGSVTVKFELKAACIGPPRPVGGWDVQNRKPKPLRRAVPEGSVYFFEANDWIKVRSEDRQAAASAVVDQCHFKSWCSLEPWPSQMEQGPGKEGFGIALIGGW